MMLSIQNTLAPTNVLDSAQQHGPTGKVEAFGLGIYALNFHSPLHYKVLVECPASGGIQKYQNNECKTVPALCACYVCCGDELDTMCAQPQPCELFAQRGVRDGHHTFAEQAIDYTTVACEQVPSAFVLVQAHKHEALHFRLVALQIDWRQPNLDGFAA